jgi:glycosyltransferase involved in cell wall biosynthesis
MDAPLVSILLPVFDAEATLTACLRSIARQSERRWECVVVDDGSSDESRELAKAFARDDERFRVLSASHRGVVDALNLGLSECGGALIARMDADDIMRRDRIALQMAALEADPKLDGVGCHVRLFPRMGLTDGMVRYENWINAVAGTDDVRREALVECPLAHPTLMLRADALRRHGYRDRGWPEDYDLVLRLLEGGGRLGVVPRRLMAWRDGPDRLSRTHERYSLAAFTACKANTLARGFLKGHPEYVLWGHGDTGRALRRALLEHGLRPSHIVELHPGRLGQHIDGALVIPPDQLKDVLPRKVVVSVAGAEARTRIRSALADDGLAELRDYVVTA